MGTRIRGIVPSMFLRVFRRRRTEQAAELVPESSSLSELALGEAFGPFRLLQKLGEGGMAEVFSAVRTDRPRSAPLVIKRLRDELAANPRAVAHFLGEASLTSALFHPSIVGVYQAGEVEGRHYLAAEYIAGRDVGALTRRMVERKQRPLSAAAILTVARDVLGALEYAHDLRSADGSSLGLVHRDITPENILIDRQGDVKLLDFGIAETADARNSSISNRGGEFSTESHAVTGELTGNLDFMSPEQARGLPVDGRSDLFSLGLVLYFCAARAPLYRKKGVYERLLLAADGPGEDERAFLAGLCPPLPGIVARLLDVDPDRRFQSARELRAVLAPHTAGGRAELAAAVEGIFGAELAAEQATLQAAGADLGAVPRRQAGQGAAGPQDRASAATSDRSDTRSWAPSRRRSAPW